MPYTPYNGPGDSEDVPKTSSNARGCSQEVSNTSSSVLRYSDDRRRKAFMTGGDNYY